MLGPMNDELWPPERFVPQPRIRPQRVKREIVGRLGDFDFVDVNGFSAVAKQNFLGQGFLLRGLNPYPDQQPFPFGNRFQSADPVTLH